MHVWSSSENIIGRAVHIYDEVGSTNTQALELAHDPTAHGLVVLAHHQASGRGQHGRSWLAPPQSSILLSVLLFPPPALQRPVCLTAWAAVAVAEFVLETTGEQARIKWPNDVFLKGKKICGILIEQRSQAGRAPAVVAGIGLNVRQPASFFQEAELPLGGSLLSQTGVLLEWEQAARGLIASLEREYERLARGDQAVESCWAWRIGLLGRQVIAETGKGEVRGRLLDMNFEQVVLQTGGGEVSLKPEAIQHLRPEGSDATHPSTPPPPRSTP